MRDGKRIPKSRIQSMADDSVQVAKKKKKKQVLAEALDESALLHPKKKKKPQVPSTSMNDLQSVEEFRHFLL